MKYNKIYKLFVSSFILVGSFTSCDYLEVVPVEQAKLEDAFSDPEATLGYLYSCYNGLNSWNPVDYLNEDVSSTDEYVLPLGWNGNSFNTQTNQRSSATGGDWTWRYCGYDPIRICHLFIDGVQTAPRVTDSQKRTWTAEAKFLVAYYHFMVLRKYGPCPIMDRAVSSNISDADMPGRSHYDEVTNYIVDLIDEAMPNLPVRWTEGDWGRIDQVVAKAIKARVLLYAASPLWNGNTLYENKLKWPDGRTLVSAEYSKEKWEKARTACKEALTFATQQGLALYENSDFDELKDLPTTFTDDQRDFMKYVFRMRYALLSRANATGKCQEVVWGTANQGSIVMGSLPHRLFQQVNGQWYNGYSGVSPTLNAIEMFYTKNGKLPGEDPDFYPKAEWYQTAGDVSNEPSYSGEINGNEIIKLNTQREPRFYAWMAFSGGEYGTKIIQGTPLILEMRNGELHGYNTNNFVRDNSLTGYLCQKWVHPNLSYNLSSGADNGANLTAPRPLIRMAELYLNLAECEAEIGTNSDFLNAINPVRRRAGIPELTEADLTTSKTAKEWVHNERFIEFYGEGIRYYDVRRWMEAPKYFGGPYYGLNVTESTSPTISQFNRKTSIVGYDVAWDDRLYLMPLYYVEVDKSSAITQAPGY